MWIEYLKKMGYQNAFFLFDQLYNALIYIVKSRPCLRVEAVHTAQLALPGQGRCWRPTFMALGHQKMSLPNENNAALFSNSLGLYKSAGIPAESEAGNHACSKHANRSHITRRSRRAQCVLPHSILSLNNACFTIENRCQTSSVHK